MVEVQVQVQQLEILQINKKIQMGNCCLADPLTIDSPSLPVAQNRRQLFHQSPQPLSTQTTPIRVNAQLKGGRERVPIEKAITQSTKKFDSLIGMDAVDAQLAAAGELAQRDRPSAIKLYEQIAISIIRSQDRGIETMEKHAYAMAQIASLSMQTDGESQTFYSHSMQALKFYKMYESEYFEEIITLLNNIALKEEKQKKYEESIKRYKQIIDLQDKYMSKNDERKLLTQNNLACLYFQCKKNGEGLKLFQKLRQQMKNQSVSREVRSLIESNQEYYKNS